MPNTSLIRLRSVSNPGACTQSPLGLSRFLIFSSRVSHSCSCANIILSGLYFPSLGWLSSMRPYFCVCLRPTAVRRGRPTPLVRISHTCRQAVPPGWYRPEKKLVLYSTENCMNSILCVFAGNLQSIRHADNLLR